MFEKLTEIKLNRDDSFSKKICLRCKVKMDSALGFREMCLLSRNNQEGMLTREKRGRKSETEYISPLPKRRPVSAEGEEAEKPRRVMSRYRQILPKTAAKTPVLQADTLAQEPHCGYQNPKVSVCLLIFVFSLEPFSKLSLAHAKCCICGRKIVTDTDRTLSYNHLNVRPRRKR